MRLLKGLLAVLTARWFVTLLGAVLLSLLIWFAGDLVTVAGRTPLAPETTRLVAILVVALLWGASNLWSQARARKRNDALVRELAPAPSAAPGSAEVAELEKRFANALDQLRKRRIEGRQGGRAWLYELPWYVMIGPPGSGKTTAILNAGLRFPLASGGLGREIRGGAGTRYCDWFFTDEAVLIDTAGRYTTPTSHPQDPHPPRGSRAEEDSAAWLGFLALLRRRRPRQPVSGVLIAVSVRDIAESAQGGIDHAEAVRARLLELEQRLGVRLPVYLLLTKADLLAGFTDFFADLDARGREQVWGATLPWAGGQQRRAVAAQPVRETVGPEVGGPVARLGGRAPGRVAAEHDLDRRAAIFGFPAQVAALKADVERFVETVFRETGYERPPLLRGVYLTSGTQTGAPLDRLMAAVTRSFGLPPAAPAQDSGERSFFLTSLLRDVVFAEAGLVGADPALERRQRWLAYGGWAAAAAVLVLVTAGWVVSYLTNSGRALGLERGLAEAGAASGPVARNKLTPADSDLGAVAPALDKLRGLPDGQADSWTGGLGLSLRPAVAQATADAYDHGLEKLLLPRLILRTEQNLRARIGDAAFVREALKVYLMLGDARANDPALLRAWFDADLRRERPDLADRLGSHIAALADLLPQVARRPALDDTLIASAQQTLARLPVEQRAYDDLMGKPEVRALPPWIVSEHAGTAAAQVLVRAGNRPLDQPIPGIFTRAGFHQVFLPGLDDAARGALEEDRKLRPGPAREITGAEVQGVQQRMLDLYYNDAIASWDDLVTSVRLVPLGALTQSVETLKVLAGPASPLKLFYQGVAQETQLTQPPDQQQGALATAEGKLAATAQQQAESSRLGKLLGNLTPTGPVKKPGQPVEDHFAPVRRLAEGQNGAPPPIDDALTGLGELRNKLQEAAAQPNPDEAFAKMGPGAITQLVQSARGLPSPLNDMVGGLAGKAQTLAAGGARRQLNDAWRTGVLRFCQSALTRRYPFAGAIAGKFLPPPPSAII